MKPGGHRPPLQHSTPDFDIKGAGQHAGKVFKEIRNVRQEPTAGRRRWFDDDVLPLELIVWYDAAEVVEGFQLCYDLGAGEHALTWRSAVGFAHNGIDTGSSGPFANRTPVLTPDGAVPWDEITRRFAGSCDSLEPPLRELVRTRLNARN